MKKVLIVTNETKDRDYSVTYSVRDSFRKRGNDVLLCDNEKRHDTLSKISCAEIWLVVIIGGDGTFIEVARLITETNLPILGVNMGTLGYLTEVEISSIDEAVSQVSTGNYEIEERMMIEGNFKDGNAIALNDIVVSRRGGLRVIHFEIFVNGELLNSYQSDGIIVSTPTGSTAYNLSAGGPIVEPTASLLLLTPICSHALNASSIVLSADDEVVVRIGKGRNETIEEACVAFDGSDTHTLFTGDKILIKKANVKSKIVKLSQVSFLETLRKKMKGN
ncbi:MAG: NAD(+)/NADH kinase [Suipraeoptans sp.]